MSTRLPKSLDERMHRRAKQAFKRKRSRGCTIARYIEPGLLAQGQAMTPETLPEPDDDPAFLNCVDRIIAGLMDIIRPRSST